MVGKLRTTESSGATLARRPGVYSAEMLVEATATGVIRPTKPLDPFQVQPASIDLRLGAAAYRLRSSFLPGAATVKDRLHDLQMGPPLDLQNPDGAVLEPGRAYLIPLMEKVNLPPDIRARANPRSSTGRLDVFTRVITNHGTQFDEISPGYEGPLWLEVYSNTFTVNVRQGLALTQLRLSSSEAVLDADDTLALHQREGLVFAGSPRQPIASPTIGARGLLLSVHLPAGDFVGWRAKRNSALLDLGAEDHYEALDYWEPVFAEAAGRLVLHPDEFLLLISKEYVRIPSDVAAEMVAYDPTNGELRTHYAGFFDPGFGVGSDLNGSRAVLEVRAHDVPFMLEDGQPIARLAYEWMAAPPTRLYGEASLRSHFQDQGVNLSRQFKRPESRMSFRLMPRG